MTRLKRLWAGLLLAAAVGVCMGQSAANGPELKDPDGVVSFAGPWRFHPGDDVAWAQASFDDSLWLQVASDKPLPAQGVVGFHGFGWYRIRVKVPVSRESLALTLPDIASSYVVYGDGQEVGHFGGMPPRPEVFLGRPMMFSLPRMQAGEQEMLLAIRVWAGAEEEMPGMSAGMAAVGARRAVRVVFEHARDRQEIFPTLALWLSTLFDVLVTIGMFAIWLGQRDHREYLLLCLGNGVFVVGNVLALAVLSGKLPVKWELFGSNAAWYGTLILALEFSYAFVAVKPGWFARLFQAVIAGFALIALAGLLFGGVSASLADAAQGPASFAVALITLVVLYPQWRAGSQGEVGIILLTSTVYFLGISVDFLAGVALQLGLRRLPAGATSAKILPDFYLHDIPIPSAAILDILLDVAFFAIVLQRHTRVNRERERTKSELAAARTVQQVMLPEPVGIIPGFSTEVVYLPAAEVGGDFYQVMKTPDGGLLLVTGDVSGKGLPAAMLVALLVGAIQTEAAHTTDPAMLLKVLNARVFGRIRNGFATCAALYLRGDGLAMLANAANPAPYLNGEELELDGALPLGLIPEIDYSTRAFWMECGDVLTFVSDGVVEAAKDRELFGFERTRELSLKGAKEIAEIARSFGQVDDITVVTVRRE